MPHALSSRPVAILAEGLRMGARGLSVGSLEVAGCECRGLTGLPTCAHGSSPGRRCGRRGFSHRCANPGLSTARAMIEKSAAFLSDMSVRGLLDLNHVRIIELAVSFGSRDSFQASGMLRRSSRCEHWSNVRSAGIVRRHEYCHPSRSARRAEPRPSTKDVGGRSWPPGPPIFRFARFRDDNSGCHPHRGR